MPLQFPTLAEQALTEFRTNPQGASLAGLARKRGATISRQAFPNASITYTFDDDTSIRTTGVGKSHKAEALLP